ncbi:hypothetical protein FW320_10970 [Azospirillum sp. Vi22]|nr:hypothetical protein [Azospirillum baldaniorum]
MFAGRCCEKAGLNVFGKREPTQVRRRHQGWYQVRDRLSLIRAIGLGRATVDEWHRQLRQEFPTPDLAWGRAVPVWRRSPRVFPPFQPKLRVQLL